MKKKKKFVKSLKWKEMDDGSLSYKVVYTSNKDAVVTIDNVKKLTEKQLCNWVRDSKGTGWDIPAMEELQRRGLPDNDGLVKLIDEIEF